MAESEELKSHLMKVNKESEKVGLKFNIQKTKIMASGPMRWPKYWSFCFIDYAKAFDCMDHNKLWKILQEMGIPEHLICLWEICMQVRKQQSELDMEQQTGSK